MAGIIYYNIKNNDSGKLMAFCAIPFFFALPFILYSASSGFRSATPAEGGSRVRIWTATTFFFLLCNLHFSSLK